MTKIQAHIEQMENSMQTFISSGDIEVQERASATLMMIQMLKSQFNQSDFPTKTITNQDLLNDINDDHENGNVISTNAPTHAITKFLNDLKSLFSGDLLPVAGSKAQRKVQLPDNLNLDEWINEPPSESSSESEEDSKNDGLFIANSDKASDRGSRKDSFEPTPEELEKVGRQTYYFVLKKLFSFLSSYSDT
jgi:AP-3 complex subunit delta-1